MFFWVGWGGEGELAGGIFIEETSSLPSHRAHNPSRFLNAEPRVFFWVGWGGETPGEMLIEEREEKKRRTS